VGVFVGPDRIPVEKVTAGNIAGVSGLKTAIAGSTISSIEMDPFEKIVHVSEPVVTVAIEAKHTKDLPKLVEVLHTVAKADPSLLVEINQETGEHLLSGMGELHLEITEYRIIKEQGVEITASQPIVVYRESVARPAGPFEGKSPNKHNRFYFEVDFLEPEIIKALKDGTIPTGKVKAPKELAKQLSDLGMDKEEAKGVYAFFGSNACINMTKGIQYLYETRELIIDAFIEAMKLGPLAREPVMGLKFRLTDAKLHEDSIHRGPAQIIPAVRNSIYGSMVLGGMTLLEPKQKVFINVPQEMMGGVTREMQQRRGTIEDIQQEGDQTTVISKAPVAELFGFAGDIRSTTQGKALWTTEFVGFDKIPGELLGKTVSSIRERKGLKPDPPTADYYSG
jgi:elongation factor 2